MILRPALWDPVFASASLVYTAQTADLFRRFARGPKAGTFKPRTFTAKNAVCFSFFSSPSPSLSLSLPFLDSCSLSLSLCVSASVASLPERSVVCKVNRPVPGVPFHTRLWRRRRRRTTRRRASSMATARSTRRRAASARQAATACKTLATCRRAPSFVSSTATIPKVRQCETTNLALHCVKRACLRG